MTDEIEGVARAPRTAAGKAPGRRQIGVNEPASAVNAQGTIQSWWRRPMRRFPWIAPMTRPKIRKVPMSDRSDTSGSD